LAGPLRRVWLDARFSGGPVEQAFAPMSLTIWLADDLATSRGDMTG
jgi:sulfate adenylyltransferase subunit 1 (EFTu-like GTPase family)